MKSAFVALAFVFIIGLLGAQQPAPKLRAPDLSNFSSQQLKACQMKHQLCGVEDNSVAVNDELAKRLYEYSVNQILNCYADWKICGVEESKPTGWPISDYLASLGDPHDLLVRYWSEHRWIVRNGIERVAYNFDTPEVTGFMRKVMIARRDDGENLYWPANYLAKKCDRLGLHWLSKGIGRNQGSMQYQTTLTLFGKCGYRPAIPMLVDDGLFDFSFNIVGGAEQSLEALYPEHPEKFDTLEDEQAYYCRRAKQEGFHLRCKSK